MNTKSNRRRDANRRKTETQHVDRIDRTQWIRPARVAPLTLPTTSYREITDEQIGLNQQNGEGLQARAEDYLRIMSAAWIRNRRAA